MHIHEGNTLASVTRSAFPRRGFLATAAAGAVVATAGSGTVPTTASAHGRETHR